MFGLAGLYSSSAAIVAVAAAILFGVFPHPRVIRPSPGDRRPILHPQEILLTSLLLVVLALVLLKSMVPPTSRDALVQHLAVPKLYLNAGRMVEIPFSIYSYYPMQVEMLYLWALALGSDIAPKILHYAFYLVTAYALLEYGTLRHSRSVGLAGALLFASIPVAANVASWAYVDAALAFYTLGTLLALDRWIETGQSRWIYLAGLAGGAAAATKYSGVLLAVILILLTLHIAHRKRPSASPAWRPVAVFVAMALLVFAPWGVRNLIWKGNPTYPLYGNIMGGEVWEPGSQSVPQLLVRRELYGQTWKDDLLLPITLSLRKGGPDPFDVDGAVGPVFLIFLLLLIRFRRRAPILVYSGYLALVFGLALALVGSVRLRYLLPVFPPLTLMVISALHALWEDKRRAVRGVVWGLVGFLLIYQGVGLYPWFAREEPLAFLSGRLSRNEYLYRHARHYRMFSYINETLPSSSKILFLFVGNEGYYCDCQYLYDSYYLGYSMKTWLRNAREPADVWAQLESRAVTHLLIDWRYLTPNFHDTLDTTQRDLFSRVVSAYLVREYQVGSLALFRVIGP